jgi:hypothetical protein
MGQAIPRQHPAVVLRSHYKNLRNLLAIAMIAVVGLTVAVVILANDDVSGPSASKPVESVSSGGVAAEHPLQSTIEAPRFDGGPEEGTRAITSASPPVTRYDGGPEEGTRDLNTTPAPVQRFDGGPEEGTRDIASAPSRGFVSPPPSTESNGGQPDSLRGPGFNTD